MNVRPTLSAVEVLESRRLFAAAHSGTEVLAQFGTDKGLTAIGTYLKANPKATLAKYVDLKHSKQLFAGGKTSLVQVRLAKGATVDATVKLLKSVPGAKWASPNYVYGRGGGEATPNDPRWTNQIDPLKQIGLDKAWDVTTGDSKLVVAVIDDGFDATHEDLTTVLWTNPGEIAGNRIDDDANGYVDDVHGYDFGRGDADPSPAFDAEFNFIESHGTQVGSIIAATKNNEIGIAGIASGVKIMPVRFRGVDVVVTSAGIAQSVAYAANNGAKIINLSYSFDPYMNDPAFNAAVDLAYAKGVLWINSSGNNNRADPPRTAVDKILFVNNVDNEDVRNPDSNYGAGTDLSAPGTQIRAAAPSNLYYPVDGTSFASAVTTGVAALIWSKHPTWTRDQVAAQLLGTTDDIDAKNPAFAGLMGTGRVNAFDAVSATITAPRLRGLTGIADGAALATSPVTLSIRTFSVLNAATINNNAFELRNAGADGAFNTADDRIVPLNVTSPYAYGSNKIDLSVGQSLSVGQYRFTAKTTIADPFGTPLAAPYVTTFAVTSQTPSAPTNLTTVKPANTQNEAELRWTDTSDNETGFVIERSTSATFATIDKSFTAVANSTRFNDWGLTHGNTYHYRVRAINASGPGVNSNTAILAIPLPPAGIPSVPSDLTTTIVAGTPTEVVLRWTDASSNETGFVIQRSTSSTFSTIDKTLNDNAGSVMYQDWGLTAGTTYYYRIRAVNGAEVSAWSNTAVFGQVTPPPPAPVTKPAAPTSLSVSGKASEMVLKWKDNAANETGYQIQRSVFSSFALLTTTISTTANATTYTDKNLIKGLTYYYRVRAINAAGESVWSNVVSIKAR